MTDARTWKVGDPCDAFVSGMWLRGVVTDSEPGPTLTGLGYVARVANAPGDAFTWSAWVARDELCPVDCSAPRGATPASTSSAALCAWMTKHAVSIAKLAERLRCSRSHVSQLRSGASSPSLGLAARIERITSGAVPAIGWVTPHDAENEASDAG